MAGCKFPSEHVLILTHQIVTFSADRGSIPYSVCNQASETGVLYEKFLKRRGFRENRLSDSRKLLKVVNEFVTVFDGSGDIQCRRTSCNVGAVKDLVA